MISEAEIRAVVRNGLILAACVLLGAAGVGAAIAWAVMR